MLALAIALGIAGATVGIRLEESEELPIETAMSIADSLGRAIEAHSGLSPVIDDLVWGACRSPDRCISEVRERTRAKEIVLVRLFGALKKVRLIADHFTAGKSEPVRFEINVPIEREAWKEPLAEAARALFPPKKIAAAEPQLGVEQRPAGPPLVVPNPNGPPIAPWVLIGAGTTALIVGSVFGLSSRSARNEVETVMHTDAEADALESRLKTHGWTANVLFAVSAIAAGTGAVLLFVE